MFAEEYDEGYNLRYLTSYARRDHLKGWDAYKILEEIKNMDFFVQQYLLDEILELEAKQEEEFDPSPNALGESSATSKENEATKRDQFF